MSANQILGGTLFLNLPNSSEIDRTDRLGSFWSKCRVKAFANYTREIHDLPNATVPISLEPSAGWIDQLAGITNISVKVGAGPDVPEIDVNEIAATGIFYQGSTPLGTPCRLLSLLPDVDLAVVALGAPHALFAGLLNEAAVSWGNIDQITTHHAIDSVELGRKVVSQECALSAQLRRLSKLEAGWDGDSSSPISGETVATAKEIIKLVLHVSLAASAIATIHLGPLPDGELRFECKHLDKELFLTVSEKEVEIQTWQPLERVEALGYWRTDLAGTREHLEWLVR